MSTIASVDRAASARTARRGALVAGLFGLAARGLLYLVLAVAAVELVVGSSGQVDARGAFHQLAHNTIGRPVLFVLIVGFAGFAIWHLSLAAFDAGRTSAASPTGRGQLVQRLGDAGRSVVYAMLCALAVTFLTTSKSSGNTDRKDQTWTAKVLAWSAGPWLVACIALVVAGAGGYVIWRALRSDRQDEHAVLDVAPLQPSLVKVLGAIGNVARGLVVGLIGAFLFGAAVTHNPSETVGLDGALKRLLDTSYGTALVLIVSAGFAAFGAYSLTRAWVNRSRPARTD
jgi:hypothetical protein